MAIWIPADSEFLSLRRAAAILLRQQQQLVRHLIIILWGAHIRRQCCAVTKGWKKVDGAVAAARGEMKKTKSKPGIRFYESLAQDSSWIFTTLWRIIMLWLGASAAPNKRAAQIRTKPCS